MEPVKRLSLKELEEWKAKAARLDRVVKFLTGNINCEKCMVILEMLEGKR